MNFDCMNIKRSLCFLTVISLFFSLASCAKKTVTTEIIESKYIIEDEPDLRWNELGKLDTYPEFRAAADKLFNISISDNSKSGCLYQDTEGKNNSNNTLVNALMNEETQQIINDKEKISTLKTELQNIYSDLKDEDILSAALWIYFDLIPEDGQANFNGGSALMRKEAMALAARSMIPFEINGPEEKADFIRAVKRSPFTDYASYMDQYSYISTSDGSLTDIQFSEPMMRGEFIYMIMNAAGFSDFSGVSAEIADCKNAGSISEKPDVKNKSEFLTGLWMDGDGYAPEEIYSAVAWAVNNGVLSEETRWSEPVTRREAVELLVSVISAGSTVNESVTEESYEENIPVELSEEPESDITVTEE